MDTEPCKKPEKIVIVSIPKYDNWLEEGFTLDDIVTKEDFDFDFDEE